MKNTQKGVVYLWALFAVTVAGVVLAGTGQMWQIVAQREKEKELLFIGDQYRKAIMSYYNNPITGVRQFPEKLEDLLEDKRGPAPIRHLRRIYIDPMTMDDEWGLIIEEPPQQTQQQGAPQQNTPANATGGNAGAGSSSAALTKGITGVYSLSIDKPRKKENFPDHFAKFSEAETYQDWHFAYEQEGGAGNNATNQQGQQGNTGGTGASSPFGGGGTARPGGGGNTANPFGGGGQAGGQTGAPVTGQNPFAR